MYFHSVNISPDNSSSLDNTPQHCDHKMNPATKHTLIPLKSVPVASCPKAQMQLAKLFVAKKGPLCSRTISFDTYGINRGRFPPIKSTKTMGQLQNLHKCTYVKLTKHKDWNTTDRRS